MNGRRVTVPAKMRLMVVNGMYAGLAHLTEPSANKGKAICSELRGNRTEILPGRTNKQRWIVT